MKECTLIEAIKLCEKNGGFYYRPSEDLIKFWLNKDGNVYDEDGEPFVLNVQDFSETWIYEPPKSAFQEWNSGLPAYFNHDNRDDIKRGRKEGWNGSLKELFKWLIRGNPSLQNHVTDKIKEMLENKTMREF